MEYKKYTFMMPYEIEPYIKDMEREKVSEIARGPNGFLTIYKKMGIVNLPREYCLKRNSFISRTLASYKKNPTFRRKLSLIAWAYNPN